MDDDELYRRAGEKAAELAPGQKVGIEYDPKDDSRWVAIYVITIEDPTLIPFEDGLAIPARFRIDRDDISIHVTTEGASTTFDVEVRNAQARVLDRLGLRPLVEQATRWLVRTTTERPGIDTNISREQMTPEMAAFFDAFRPRPRGSRVSRTAATAAVRRMLRTKITQTQVETAAVAYRDGWRDHPAGIEAVKAALHVEERQAYRYMQRAWEQGLAERQRAPRRPKERKK